MWSRMSPASQSKVKENPDYENPHLNLDCVRLWGFIRRTHPTHVFGEGDPLREINIQEHENRYANLRQEEKEPISIFKSRFDNQQKASEGAGVAATTDSKKAMEFLGKLDQRRYSLSLAALAKAKSTVVVTMSALVASSSSWSHNTSGTLK